MIRKKTELCKPDSEMYKHYLALDWSEKTMAWARLSCNGQAVKMFEEPSNLRSLKKYLKELKGTKILTIEETTSTHWLYVELLDFADRILICDPYRNGLLKEGPKTDKYDSRDLCKLLRAGMLKEVFHSTDKAYDMRKLLSAYNDIVQSVTRYKNQKSALYRSLGRKYKKEGVSDINEMSAFIDKGYTDLVAFSEERKKEFVAELKKIGRTEKTVKDLMTISGIGIIWAMTIYATVVDINRFPDKYSFFSYCGLAYNLRESGGRTYGRKMPRHSRELKKAFTSAARSALNGKNDIGHYYTSLLKTGLDLDKSFSAVRRHIAKSAYAVMKNKEKYKALNWRKNI